MALMLALVLFVALTVSVTFFAMRYLGSSKDAIKRVAGSGVEQTAHLPQHPSLSLQEFLQKLGSFLPANPKEVSKIERRLLRAGYRRPNAVQVLHGSKVVLAVLLPMVALAVATYMESHGTYRSLFIGGSAIFGYIAPDKYLKFAAGRRQREIRRGLPNALDLLVVCVESGLGLDQAIAQVAKELDKAHPDVSEEFGLVTLELKAGKRRAEALRNLADRTKVDELGKLVSVLIQADRFGTGIAQSLRGHAEYMRTQARQTAEEKAAKVGVKLVFPIFFCILPSLFVVTVGPIAVRIVRELIPMMQSI